MTPLSSHIETLMADARRYADSVELMPPHVRHALDQLADALEAAYRLPPDLAGLVERGYLIGDRLSEKDWEASANDVRKMASAILARHQSEKGGDTNDPDRGRNPGPSRPHVTQPLSSQSAGGADSRPDWREVYRNVAHSYDRDDELITITRESARLLLTALEAHNADDYYHNFGAAQRELEAVLAGPSKPQEGEK